MKPIQVIYEKGITVRLRSDGFWYLQSIRESDSLTPIVPEKIKNLYGVRPVLVMHQLDTNMYSSSLLSLCSSKEILNLESSQHIQGNWSDLPTLYEYFNLGYIIGAVVYHCMQLAQTYSDICFNFAHMPFPGNYENDRVSFGHQPTPYYETDALITAARRAYDTLRYILWRAFGPNKGSIPASFIKTLPLCTNLPPSLSSRLQLSWNQYGEKLTAYRDCIQHYVPLDHGLSTAHMTRLDNGVWSTSLLLPDNPEVKSKALLKYSNKIDALNYGWKLTNEIVDLATIVYKSIPN